MVFRRAAAQIEMLFENYVVLKDQFSPELKLKFMRFHTFLRDDVTRCAALASIKGAHLEHFSWVLSAPSRTVGRQDRSVFSRVSQTDGSRKIRSNKDPTSSVIQKCPHENKNKPGFALVETDDEGSVISLNL